MEVRVLRVRNLAAAILVEYTPMRDALRNTMVVQESVENRIDSSKECVYDVRDDDGTAMNLSTTRRRMPGIALSNRNGPN